MMANHHDLLRQQVLCDPDTQLKKILDIDNCKWIKKVAKLSTYFTQKACLSPF
tara:strand:- start:1905 stop:2063 length:159 start_codon:yes stop_codon:yes gene_type:complete